MEKARAALENVRRTKAAHTAALDSLEEALNEAAVRGAPLHACMI